MALQRAAPDPAAARDDALGVSGAAVPGHADQPRRPAHAICPEFDLGVGLTRPAGGHDGRRHSGASGADVDGKFQPSLDVTQRLGANVLASLTVNTDFAETEVDTRRTNLTRFPLFFPEKRTFFLEGGDIFSFGLGLDEDVIPFFSRRIGLVEGSEVPIIAGGKINGRVGDTNFGGLVVGTNDKRGVVPDEAVMAVGRVKQNIWSESWLGAIATVGDPLGAQRQLAGRRRLHVCDLALSRRQELPGRRVGRWRPAATDLGSDATRVRLQGRLSERPLGHRADRTSGSAATSIRRSASCRGGPCICIDGQIDNSTRISQRSVPAAVARVRADAGDRPVGQVGELPRVHRAGQLALPQRRSLRAQRQSRRANGWSSRSRSPTAW